MRNLCIFLEFLRLCQQEKDSTLRSHICGWIFWMNEFGKICGKKPPQKRKCRDEVSCPDLGCKKWESDQKRFTKKLEKKKIRSDAQQFQHLNLTEFVNKFRPFFSISLNCFRGNTSKAGWTIIEIFFVPIPTRHDLN